MRPYDPRRKAAFGGRLRPPFVGAAAFLPTDLANLVLWLRSDLGVTLNGADVSAWADQSGEGNDAAQGTASDQPTYNASDAAFNGHPTVPFSGPLDQAEFMTVAHDAALGNADDLDMILVVGGSDFAGNGEYFTKWGALGNEWGLVHDTVLRHGPRVRNAADTAHATATALAPTLADGTVRITRTTIDAGGASVTARADLGTAATAQTGAGVNTGTAPLGLGGRYQDNSWADIIFAEILIFRRILTDAERDQVYAYLSDRYALGLV